MSELAERIADARARARELDRMDARRVRAMHELAEAEAALRRAEKRAAAAEQALAGDAPMSETRGGTTVL